MQEHRGFDAELADAFIHDELTGERLPPGLVANAREEECAFMENWGVWQEVPVAECWQRTGRRPIGTRWVDVNKGDLHHPDVRCRLVAQEVNTYKEDAFFAATPPLEALRLLLSHVATGRKGRVGGRKVMILDAKPPRVRREGGVHRAASRRLRQVDQELVWDARRTISVGAVRRCPAGVLGLRPWAGESVSSAMSRATSWLYYMAMTLCLPAPTMI